ncbi:MAG: PQQ-dependent dehydrogenase, methanol/ethanol family [Parasphingopyxis sp.]|nr:PQQ-dependent dehydrogenase, methanol/ethanol family [Sphingomonadales bacterium]
MTISARTLFPLLFASLLLFGCSSKDPEEPARETSPRLTPADVDGELLATGGDGSSWVAANFNYQEQRFSPLDQIDRSNVSRLGVAWTAELPDARAQEATPIVVGRRMFVTGPWSKIFAFNAVTGEALWSFDPEVERSVLRNTCCDAVNRGVAVWRGRLYLGTLDGRLISIDANTGAQLWSTQTTDRSQPYTITGTPRVVDNKVIIGNGGAEFGVRGYVSAYDANDGRLLWRFYTVPNPEGEADNAASDQVLRRAAARTWSEEGQWRESGGGGTVWDAIVYDHELDQLYIGVGNGSPWNHGARSQGRGDNLFLSSIVALDPDTGEYLWHYQETPGESWDFTATQHIILADLRMPVRDEEGGIVEGEDGEPRTESRKVLMQAPKNGFFFVIDRTNGELISADPFIEGINWAEGYNLETGRPIENPAARFYRTGEPFISNPGPIGAHNWQPMAYNRETGLVYIPANIAPQIHVPAPGEGPIALGDIGFNTGGDWSDINLPRDEEAIRAAISMVTGQLVAFDPVAGEVRWTADYPTPWNGGIMTTAGGLVFQGTAMGQFKAYDAASGEELWSMDTQSGVLAGASTYQIDGVQYVAFTTGRGGAFAITAGRADRAREIPNIPRLVVLRLGGDGRLPPAPAGDERRLDPPESTGSEAQIAQGQRLFNRYCLVCHGEGAVGGGVNPDLRFSGILGDSEGWRDIVIGGALRSNGMPSFSSAFDGSGANAIRHYVIDKANWDLERIRARREEEGEG